MAIIPREVPHPRHLCQLLACREDLVANAVCRVKIILGDEFPNLIDVPECPRREFEVVHPRYRFLVFSFRISFLIT
jgi:hypothetical protein